jgi:SagB-type dehydrogenase family enzyme
MTNREIEAAWKYHNGTKHSYQSIRANPHTLDWENQPIPFKIYPGLEATRLGQQISSSGVSALSAIAAVEVPSKKQATLTRQSLAEVFFLSAGITKRRSYPGGEMLYRAAACTGALYHIDLYLVCGDLEDLAAGVYHFGPHDFSLRALRKGDYRSLLHRAGGQEPSLVRAEAIIICASTYWRNAWKYQARAYRHCYWDSGTILANLLAGAAARCVPAKVVMGFVDYAVNNLLGLDIQREASLVMVALGDKPWASPETSPRVEPLTMATQPLSRREVDYPSIRAMHEASSLGSEEEVADWRLRTMSGKARPKEEVKASQLFSLTPLAGAELPQDEVEKVVLRRGSTRRFARLPITFQELSTMLDRATRGIPADFLDSANASLNDVYLIVHAVKGLPAGAYFYRREERALELLEGRDFRREAGLLGLGQELPADCSVNVYFMTDLGRVLERFGNRGYRAAQLEASIMGGKLYLAAYAQRLGASGLTFFDDDVTEFFSPHAEGKSVMFLIALGKSVTLKGLNGA